MHFIEFQTWHFWHINTPEPQGSTQPIRRSLPFFNVILASDLIHTYNPSTVEVEARLLLALRPA